MTAISWVQSDSANPLSRNAAYFHDAYAPEFRAEAVKLVLARRLTLEEAAQRIAMPKGTLGNWVSATKCGDGRAAAPGSHTVSELEAENARLRKERAQTRMEQDVVKKAAAYFARESPPGIPDGIVAWASDAASDPQEAAPAATRWFDGA